MEKPAWWDKDRERRNATSRRQEVRHARKEGGKVQAGSGSSRRAPQDVKTPEFLDQLKGTDKKSYRLTAEEFLAVEKDAITHGREPRMIIEFYQYDLQVVVQRMPK